MLVGDERLLGLETHRNGRAQVSAFCMAPKPQTPQVMEAGQMMPEHAVGCISGKP